MSRTMSWGYLAVKGWGSAVSQRFCLAVFPGAVWLRCLPALVNTAVKHRQETALGNTARKQRWLSHLKILPSQADT
jgi:hypothetical protein